MKQHGGFLLRAMRGAVFIDVARRGIEPLLQG